MATVFIRERGAMDFMPKKMKGWLRAIVTAKNSAVVIQTVAAVVVFLDI